MQKYPFLTCAACAATAMSTAPAATPPAELTQVDQTFLDFTLNAPADFNFEMNRQLHRRPLLNTDFFGVYEPAGLLKESAAVRQLTLFGGANVNWFESHQ